VSSGGDYFTVGYNTRKVMKKIVIGTVSVFLLGASPVFANPFTGSDTRPEVQTYNGIPYMSGGFGLEERAELKAMGKTDNLELSFALRNKAYIGSANVLIKDRNGSEILEAVSDGPLFLTKLPEGLYTVKATAMGKTLEQTVHVPSRGQARLYFAWEDSLATHTLAKK
jgi:hypothetical protein